MEASEKAILQKLANTVRGLSIDAIQAANSGHPGLPLGCAEIGACLYGKTMAHNPANPDWLGRDRFVLSAGHGSMLLYSLLHLSGYDLSLNDLKNFRQLGSPTPGHPEYGEAPGVETTTGPLGQGLATAAGMALGNKMAAARLGVEDEGLLDGQIFVLAGDGCMMEGVTNEAASLAGHLQLDNLVVIYDSNDICLDGPTSECFTEDTGARYQALGWAVTTIDGHDLEAIESALEAARGRKDAPTLIIAKTTIGKGSPNKEGTSSVHGSPLGDDEAALTKKNLGLPEDFCVPDEVSRYMKGRLEALAASESDWREKMDAWRSANPDGAKLWDALAERTIPADLDEKLRALEIAENSPGRKSSSAVLQALHDLVPSVAGGSADLSCSDNTMMKASGVVSARDMTARNIKFGVREFATGAMTSGLYLQGMHRPFCGTFLVFSDYMRNAIRLAALMKLPVIYQFTHDSIFLGEDGPTHQPVEHVASLRAIPNLTVFRPADANEVRAAWSWALRKAEGPVAMALTRQNLPDLAGTSAATDEGVGRGGYVVKAESGSGDRLDVCLCASGSEVSLALEVAEALEAKGLSVRVASMPSFEIFDAQDAAWRESVIPSDARLCVSVEAAASLGWHKYVGRDGLTIAMESFGTSAPGKQAGAHFGFETDQIVGRIEQRLEA